MIDHCTLYLASDHVDVTEVVHGGVTDGTPHHAATWYDYDLGDGPVRLNLGHPEVSDHLAGFKAYVAQLPDLGTGRRSRAQNLIDRTQTVIGVMLPQPIEPESPTFHSLIALIDRFDGFMFVAGSIMLPDGSFVVGPMAPTEEEGDDGPIEPTVIEVDPEEHRHLGPTTGLDPKHVAMREAHYRALAERGYRCSRTLPLTRNSAPSWTIRPTDDLANRLLALYAVFLWVAAPESIARTDRLEAFVARNGLRDHLVTEEHEILDLPRPAAVAAHADMIGWKLETIWALSWVLGYEPAPPFHVGQLPQEVIDDLVFHFLPNLDGTVDDLLATTTTREASEVARLEDLYYCAHNAVRSAQLGRPTVPDWFHPVRDGGAVHERRHALTWALSPSVAWDETDLST